MAKDYDPGFSAKREDEPYGFGARRRDSSGFDKYPYGDNYRPPGFSGGTTDYANKAGVWAKRRMNEVEFGCRSAGLSRAEHSANLQESVEDVRKMRLYEKVGIFYQGGD